MVLETLGRRRISRSTAAGVAAWIWFGATAVAATGSGGDDPDPTWDALAAEYSSSHTAIVLHHDVDIKILFDTNVNMSSSVLERRKLAVFDATKAADLLDLAFLIPPGYKVKSKRASASEYRNGRLVSGATAEESDFHERTRLGGWKELRVAVPGLAQQGYVDVQIELASSGPPYFSIRFDQPLMVRRGTCRLRVPSTAHGATQYVTAALEELAILPRGSVERADEQDENTREINMVWVVENIPPTSRERLVPADEQPHASLDILPADWTWRDWAGVLKGELEKIEVPKKLLKAVQDTLRGRPPEEAIQGIARYLDDPGRFKLRGNPRSLNIGFPNLETVVQNQGGGAFTKAVLASRLLSKLNIRNDLVLAASLYRTHLDWRSTLLDQFDAVLILVPGISPNFLWDVGARWVPIGHPGADLYPSMLVLNPERDDVIAEFSAKDGIYKEIRSAQLELGSDGGLSSRLTIRYESFPQIEGMDPWDPTVNLPELMTTQLPADFQVSDATWSSLDHRTMRCSMETPAVLDCRLTSQAIPLGESGWEVRPFVLDLPFPLNELSEGERKSPLLLTDRIEVTEAIFVTFAEKTAGALQPPVAINNGIGSFLCSWEMREGGVFGIRKLSLSPAHLPPSRVGLIQDLCRAWDDAGSRAIRVE